MDSGEVTDEAACEEEKDGSDSCSPSGSLASSLSSSQDFRRQLRPPNRKKYDENMDELMKQIRTKETEQKAASARYQEIGQALRGVKSEREAAIGKRKKIDGELRLLNQDITKKMGSLSRVESNLHYKNEAKIDDAISNMEWQLKTQNFRLAEERKIVAEIDKLKRSKKVLVEYFSQKKDVDKIRENQRRMRGERDFYNKNVSNLGRREEELRKSSRELKANEEVLKQELNQLHEKKRLMISEFKQNEADFQKLMAQKRTKQRQESFKKREEDRKAKEEALWQERLKYEALKEPFEDEKNLCNTLFSYLQRYNTAEREEMMLPSPRDEQPEHPIGSTPGPADSLDDGMFVRLKKSEEDDPDYTVTVKRPNRRSRKGRKLSVTKPLAHTPQIIAQFNSLNLNAPSNMSEVPASIEQLLARKRYYEEQSGGVPRPLLANLSGSFSSSGSLSSLDSPMRERSSTWGFVVEVPPAIAEHQTHSDAGTSADTGFHDMSRQASKTESSESAQEISVSDQVLAEIIAQDGEVVSGTAESEYSRSSSDTITPDEHLPDEGEVSSNTCPTENTSKTGSKNATDIPKEPVLVSPGRKDLIAAAQKLSKCDTSSQFGAKSELGAKIPNYDDDFPPVLPVSIETPDIKQKTSLAKGNGSMLAQRQLTLGLRETNLFKNSCEGVSKCDSNISDCDLSSIVKNDDNKNMCDKDDEVPKPVHIWNNNRSEVSQNKNKDIHSGKTVNVSETSDVSNDTDLALGQSEEHNIHNDECTSHQNTSSVICKEDIVTHL